MRPVPGAPCPYDVVAVAASAGGLQAITYLVAHLPATFGVPVLVVQHLDPRHRSLMAQILGRRTSLTVREAAEGDRPVAGEVLIAPPDHHLLLSPDGTVGLSQSEMVHFLRPSADLLFESVATSRRDRAIAVVLSGSGSDGAVGVRAVKKMGGTVIVQDEKTAEFSGMPSAATQTGAADFVLPLEEIPAALVSLCAPGDTAADPEGR